MRENFPVLRAEAIADAQANVETFLRQFEEKIAQNIGRIDPNRFKEPDIQSSQQILLFKLVWPKLVEYLKTIFKNKVLPAKTAPNKACAGRLGFVAIFKHFSGFGFFLLSNRIHARPRQ